MIYVDVIRVCLAWFLCCVLPCDFSRCVKLFNKLVFKPLSLVVCKVVQFCRRILECSSFVVFYWNELLN